MNDSKKLSAKQRERLFEIILKNVVDYSIVLVSHITIDKINILNAVRLGNKLCVEALKKVPKTISDTGEKIKYALKVLG